MIAELEREEFARIVEGIFPPPQGSGVTEQKRRTHQRRVGALNDLFTNSFTLEGVRVGRGTRP